MSLGNGAERVARPERLGRGVYDQLLRQLMSLAIAPGDRITVDAVARALAVSQTPVREALAQLETQGLVIKTHLAGYRAAPQMTQAQFHDLCELRLLIEPALAAKAARRVTVDMLAEITSLAPRFGSQAGDDEQLAYDRFAEADARFHAAIARAAGNDLLVEILTRQSVQLRLFRLRLTLPATHAAFDEHARIVAALAARDPGAAEAAMRLHIEHASARFADVFRA